MLSFVYTLLANTVASALETVGLDPYVGFMHTDRLRPPSLALDLMEEAETGSYGDRFVLTLINRKMVAKKIFPERRRCCHHERRGTEAFVVRMAEQREKEMITHPYLNEEGGMGNDSFCLGHRFCPDI